MQAWSLALGVGKLPVTRTLCAGSSEDLTESTPPQRQAKPQQVNDVLNPSPR